MPGNPFVIYSSEQSMAEGKVSLLACVDIADIVSNSTLVTNAG